jgi:hypothetical protein
VRSMGSRASAGLVASRAHRSNSQRDPIQHHRWRKAGSILSPRFDYPDIDAALLRRVATPHSVTSIGKPVTRCT